MRRTRLVRMYLPKVPQKDPNAHPLQVQNSQHFLRTAGVGAVLTLIISAFLALRQVQQRSRLSEKELLRKRKGKRVVIIGGGAGGSALAALIANSAPDLKVTVIEKDKQQVFLGHVPLAHVGHRSYDIATSTGVDIVRSPAAWNVTRDANLVAAEVLRVDPEAKKVYVRTTKAILAAATVPKTDDANDRRPCWGLGGLLHRCWPSHHLQISTLSVNDDGSANLSDGTTSFSYDALVVAAGAHRSLGSLAGQLQPAQLDTHRIAVNPGTTRDNLVNLFSGNVLHVKVPPASFVLQMEAARALMTAPRAAQGNGVRTLDLGKAMSRESSTPPPTETSSTKPPSAEEHTFFVPTLLAHWFGTSRTAAACPEATGASLIPDEVAERLRRESGVATAVSPLVTLAQWCMHYSSRQHDSTFVSSVNTIWKYLHYYNKLGLCHYMAVTADPQPIGPAPRAVNEVIEKFWRGRQLACQQHGGGVAERFHLLFHTYLAGVDTTANVATLYDYRNHAEVRVPYNLLVLDLPLCAPSFVRQSGLHRTRYVEECVIPALRCGVDEVTARQLRKHPLLHKTKKELEAFFADEASFMDVDHKTLQHRRYAEIFALGDVAGVPSLKSYGAVSAQVPVVAHNVQQVLASQKLQAPQDCDVVEVPRSETSAAVTPAPVLPKANAKYTGYSSFHVVMTTWRAMWPEMCYDEPQTELRCCSQSSSPADLAEAATKRRLDVVAPLAHCDHHLWNSLAWRDVRGFLNGLFHELALYEIMYFFIFSRGLWHSPSFFYVPTYSPIDGTPRVPTWRDLL
ncbi:hypothetical protein, conserved [Leishmania tarentolae]|uniref:FAD/NAD(P)-binding domain-containing protein n=1 Tax=Leishmania tarentolae TaxID=5689 RepID=A0A640KR61_LEITA|nr:hypothetical protein, conserved [Leishmania tarentolae]